MIDDEDHPYFKAAAQALNDRLKPYESIRVTRQSIQEMQNHIDLHRIEARRANIDFPELVIVAVPRLAMLFVRPRHWTRDNINDFCLQLVRLAPQITAQEVAEAIKRSWPHHKVL